MNKGRRSLGLALTALLGRTCEVIEGVPLAGCHHRIQIPPNYSGGPFSLTLALQAALVGPQMALGSPAEPWYPTLVNLAASRHLRAQWPGLASAYASMEMGWWSWVARGVAAGVDPGSLLVARLLPHAELPLPNPIPATVESQVQLVRAWLLDSSGPLPPVTLEPPALPLPYQATKLAEGTTKPPGPAGLAAGSAEVILTLAPANEPATRIVVLGPERVKASGAMEEVESAATSLTGPGIDAIGELPCRHQEWDFERGRYLDDWCSVYEVRPGIRAGTDDLAASPAAIRRVRLAFQRASMRERRSRLEPEGSTPDIDAVVAAFAENRLAGHERLYRDPTRGPGDTAVAVVADLSESTSGRTLDLERAALTLVGAALPSVGDEFCMLGFRGRSRDDCQVLWVKDFGEPFGQPVRERIRSLAAWGFTRIAPCLRHVGEILQETECQNQILLLVTDGMPYDCDGYGGQYAMEDTRRAFIELQTTGVRSYCLTVDSSAGHYLSRMCGPARWTVVTRRDRLPEALLALYGRVRF